ncbi:Os03g0381800 [Oryza sativa Japonica Group]|uniref:Os03g0381800 protein n=1 Tax=Oryza sativa subsp. japonica TaxID=39947 RepID=A0A0P0VYV9_ORYSJ|nr:Os03g0381800 [Oryza sativa Japonica Group]
MPWWRQRQTRKAERQLRNLHAPALCSTLPIFVRTGWPAQEPTPSVAQDRRSTRETKLLGHQILSSSTTANSRDPILFDRPLATATAAFPWLVGKLKLTASLTSLLFPSTVTEDRSPLIDNPPSLLPPLMDG